MKKVYEILLIAALSATGAFAQQNSVPFGKQSGLYEATSISTGHDSSAGWSSEVESAIGYDFNSHFSLEAGTPFWLVTTTQGTSTSGTGTTTISTTHSNSLGDAFLRLRANAYPAPVNFGSTFTATAPTGDTRAGVSTGRATFNWDNRFDHSFDRVTPFAEASIGNSLTTTTRNRRDYTTLGAVSELRGGMNFDLFKGVSLEGSGYGDFGYGNQKIYSQIVHKGGVAGVGAGNSKHNRAYETAYLTTGTASLVNDNGITADVSWNPTPRFSADVSYTHSLHYVSDSISVTLGMRMGHIPTQQHR